MNKLGGKKSPFSWVISCWGICWKWDDLIFYWQMLLVILINVLGILYPLSLADMRFPLNKKKYIQFAVGKGQASLPGFLSTGCFNRWSQPYTFPHCQNSTETPKGKNRWKESQGNSLTGQKEWSIWPLH